MRKIYCNVLMVLALVVVVSCGKDENDPKDQEGITTEEPVTRTINVPSTGTLTEPVTRYYSLETGLEVNASEKETKKWDISFTRMEIRINSAFGVVGLVLKNKDILNVSEAPQDGYKKEGEFEEEDESGIVSQADNTLFVNWFNYFQAETLSVQPKPNVYIIKTVSGKYVKLQLLSYYNESGAGGFYKFQYTIQPGGSRQFEK